MVGLLIVIAVLVVLDLAAIIWGADSRTTTGDPTSPHV